MGWHEEMWQTRLVDACARRRLQYRPFAKDLVRSAGRQEIELPIPRPAGAMVGQVDDVSLALPLIAAWGESTKLFSPSDRQ
jgi:hypothetical protein